MKVATKKSSQKKTTCCCGHREVNGDICTALVTAVNFPASNKIVDCPGRKHGHCNRCKSQLEPKILFNF